MNETPSHLTNKAKEVSRLCRLWLENPFSAHAAHEAAASAHEREGNSKAAAEHRKAATYWANKELEENSKRYGTQTN